MNIEIWIKESDLELIERSKQDVLDMIADLLEDHFYNYSVEEA